EKALTFPPMSRLLALSLLTWDSAMSAPFLNLDSTYPGFQFLELLLAPPQCQLLCLIQTVLQVLHGLFQVFLHPLQVLIPSESIIQSQSIISAPDFSIQGALHGLRHPLVIPLQLFNFLILLCNLPVDIRLDLAQLQLHTQDFPFFVFQRALEQHCLSQ
uniref:Uncharacterized protein n=1 Tax=Sphenodon punctatus TaxID=8508 RepID=A0A8D0GRU3_SPHPU